MDWFNRLNANFEDGIAHSFGAIGIKPDGRYNRVPQNFEQVEKKSNEILTKSGHNFEAQELQDKLNAQKKQLQDTKDLMEQIYGKQPTFNEQLEGGKSLYTFKTNEDIRSATNTFGLQKQLTGMQIGSAEKIAKGNNETTRYGADRNYQATQYVADKQLEATKLNNKTQRFSSALDAYSNAINSVASRTNSIMNAGTAWIR